MKLPGNNSSTVKAPSGALRFKRIVNLIKVVAGYLFSRFILEVKHWGKPVSVSIEPTNHCNLRCPECPTGMRTLKRPSGSMNLEQFKMIIDQLSPELHYLTFYFQGEPYMNPQFHDMIRYAKEKQIYVATSTNGHFLTTESALQTISSGLDKLIISLDGTDEESYAAYRVGGSFKKVMDGIGEIVRLKDRDWVKHPLIELQFIVLKTNQHQVEDFLKLKEELGVDKVTVKTAQHYDLSLSNPRITDLPKYSRYHKTVKGRAKIPQYGIKNKMPDHCFRMWSSCVITWDGTVVPCCYDKDAEHPLGNLNETPFMEIWKGAAARAFRREIMVERKGTEICTNCPEGMGFTYYF